MYFGETNQNNKFSRVEEEIYEQERQINYLQRELEFKALENSQMKKNNQLLQENLN